MKSFFFGITALGMFVLISCSRSGSHSDYLLPDDPDNVTETLSFGLDQVARIFAALPLETPQLQEVYDAVSSSSENGYDEEYTMKKLLTSPGSGIGESQTKASQYLRPLRDLLSEYLHSQNGTKAGIMDADAFLKELEESDLQIYWPYSEDWDKETMPIITFDPGYGSEYNYGYKLSYDRLGKLVVDSVYVDESVALKTAVWVINNNRDAESTPIPIFTPEARSAGAVFGENERVTGEVAETGGGTKAMNRILKLKSFTMLRNYDTWFQGGSEFFIKCGSVNGFSASTEAELKLYSPSVTDFMLVVKRKYLNVKREYDAIILTNFTNQLDNLAFLITEDDGGTQTSWKCSATVKIKSKSYGFDVDIPYKENDDIVWRGQLSANFFQSEDVVHGRFGDVEVEFTLE